MEIIAENTIWWAFIVMLTLLIAFAGIFITVFIYGLVDTLRKGWDAESIIALVLLFILSALSIAGSVEAIIDGPPVEYKAIVTDWNAVYDGGYEVIDIDGKIVTLRKD